MRLFTSFSALGATAALALLAGCGGGGSSAIAPSVPSAQGTEPYSSGQFPVGNQASPFYNCPATGRLTYISIYDGNAIYIYSGMLRNQTACGVIATGVSGPYGLFVNPTTHDLYVANSKRSNIKVFHRGHVKAYNTYVDPTNEDPIDVAVAADGTVVASNVGHHHAPGPPSLSTWLGGPNGGTFVGNFRMTNAATGGFITIKENGTVYFNDVDSSFKSALWTVTCPSGACGTQTQVSGVTFDFPAGMVFDDTGDLLVIDSGAITLDTFELPNPTPSTCPLTGAPIGVAFDRIHHTFVITDDERFGILEGLEYTYPGCVLIGRVGTTDSNGIAIDL